MAVILGFDLLNHDFEQLPHFCSVLERDPYHLACMPIHLAAALELKRKNELFLLAHKLVQEYPQKAIAWFAVGCYYYCIRNYDSARRYFA
jgi:anaphase-promoting complex subunit 6